MSLKPLAFILLLLLFLPTAAFSVDCSDAYSYADDAYTQAKRGYNSGNLDDAQYYARKAMSAAEDAMSAAEECGCDDAYSAADEAYDYAKKAYRSNDYDDAINYLRKAKLSADDAMSYADDCGTYPEGHRTRHSSRRLPPLLNLSLAFNIYTSLAIAKRGSE